MRSQTKRHIYKLILGIEFGINTLGKNGIM